MVQPAQRQVVDTAPRGIMFVLPQCCAGHGINGGFVDFHGIAGFRFGGNQKAILFLAARDISAKAALTAALKSRARYAVFIFAHKNAVAVVAARGLVQDSAAHAVAQDFRADATVHQIGRCSFGVPVRRRQHKGAGCLLLHRCCLSRLNRDRHRCHFVQQPYR